MESRLSSRFSALIAFVTIFLFSMSVRAGDFTTSYCSTQNTGGSSKVFTWTWQSNGKCTDYCTSQGNYAFAVIKYTDCWCTNYIPAQQVDTGLCMKDCPGFPDEKCGDKDKNLFIYIKMAGTPSGTQGAAQSTPASPVPAPPSRVVTSFITPNPITVTRTATVVVPTSTLYSSSPSVTATLKPVPSSVKTSTPDDDPVTSIWIVTESGAVVTRTVIATPTSAPSKIGSEDSKTNIGAIVGGVVGGVLVLLAVVAGILFLLWRRKKQQQEEYGQVGSSSGITRNTSTMSKAGLMGGSSEKDIQYPPRIVTSNYSTQGSRHDADSISPVTGSDRRYSQPLIIDSRLDPRAVLTFHGSNVSRDSLASIDDSRDYGRQLNVRNPDPEHR